MGKGGKPKVEVTEYYMSEHFGICMGADALVGLTIKEKEAWTGEETEQTAIIIDQPELFGGVKKEGGLAGLVHYLPGNADQVLPDVLAQKLGRADGADCPGYRGIASLFFTGGGGGSGFTGTLADIVILMITKLASRANRAGFYWTANTPYLPGVWATVRRAPLGLDPAYALVPRGTEVSLEDEHVYEDLPGAWSYQANVLISRVRKMLYIGGNMSFGAPFSAIDAETRSIIVTGSQPAEIQAVDPGGTFWAGGSEVISVDPDTFTPGSYASGQLKQPDGVTNTSSANLFAFEDEGDPWIGIVPFFNSPWLMYWRPGSAVVSLNTLDLTGTAWSPSWFVQDTAGTFWTAGAVSNSTTTLHLYNITDSEHFAITGLADLGFGGHTIAFRHYQDETHNHFLVEWGSDLLIVDHDTGALIDTVTGFGGGSGRSWKNGRPTESTWYQWVGFGSFSQHSAVDGSTIRTLNIGDWATGTQLGGVWDELNHAWVGLMNDGSLRWHFVQSVPLEDANPSHMIYECLTNTEWGMGSPIAALDYDSFDDASIVLYDEGLGLSMLWVRQSSIQDFVQEVLDHIQAVLFVDPSTGLLTLKLIRGDYDPDDLPILTPDNADLTSFGRKLWGDIVNEIVVTWTNPANEQEETVTVQDDSSIATQGGPVSDSRNYYGVRYAALAQKLAYRDLRSAGQPLASCEAEVDRTQWRLRPASVVKLTWPEYGLTELVMRVTSVDYGKPGDPTIKLALIEDVYGLDIGDYDTPPSTAWVDPSAPPAPLDPVEIFTLPLFFAAGSTVAAFVNDPIYPEVVAGVLATTTSDDTYSYDLWDKVPLPNGTLDWQSLGTNNIIGRGLLVDPLVAEATSDDVAFDDVIGQTAPVVGGFIIIGEDGETGNEIAMVESVSGGFSLTRGVLDTVPRAWPAGTPAWFVDGSTLFEDPLIRSAGEVVDYKLLSRTSQGLLPLISAPLESATLSDRPWLPNRPANVEAYGEAWSSETYIIDARSRPDPWVTVTWANRNRLTEDSQVLAWTDGTVTPEDGQTTTIEVRKLDGTLLATHDGLTGTTFDVPDASFGVETFLELRVYSERSDDDGEFVSLQYFSHWIWVDGEFRVTEDDEERLTEDGVSRQLED